MEKIIETMKIPAKVEATLDQRKGLDGADFVVITIMVGGYDKYKMDVAIPAKYGVLQTVSDTTGPGGVMRILRTAPVFKQIAENLREVSPKAWILNYANPMVMNTGTLLRLGHERTVGLCHSIQGCAEITIATWLGIPPDEIDYTAAGINHRNFYLTLKHNGKDLHPALLAKADEIIAKNPAERLRFELLNYLGYFPAEGPMHQAEYYPWFMKDEATADHYGAKTYWGYTNDSKHFKTRTAGIKAQLTGESPINFKRSNEYGVRIIHSLITGTLRKFYGNVRNDGLIRNLPQGCTVEVPCMVDRNGIQPCAMGDLPPQLAAVMTPHVWLAEMAVEGALTQNRALLRQAIQADPLTGAILTLPKIREMTDELLAANKEYLGGWR